jgi:hypothetical protein
MAQRDQIIFVVHFRATAFNAVKIQSQARCLCHGQMNSLNPRQTRAEFATKRKGE